MVNKVIRWLIIPIFCILLMSHNTFAEVTYNQNLTFVKRLVGDTLYYGDDKANFTWKRGTQVFSAGQGTTYFRFGNAADNFPVSNHQLIVLTGSFYATSAYATTFNTSGLLYVSEYYLNCPVVDISFDTSYMQNETGRSQITYRQPFTVVCEMTSNATRIAMNIAVNNDSPVASNIGIYFSSLTVFEKDTTLKELYDWLRNNSGSDSSANVLQQEKQDVQDAADNSESAGDSSSSDAEQGTSSLISAIGSAVSVISSASPTNCRINGDMGNLDVGQIDLCANPVPTFIQVIGSLILILITVPLCITLFNRFIGLFRSFQG